MNLLSLGEKTVKLAEKLGADECEVYLTSVDGNSITFADKIESVGSFSSTGLGVRLIVNKRIGFYSTSSLSDKATKQAVRTALAIAKASNQNHEWVSLPTRTGKAQVKGVFDKEIEVMKPSVIADAVALIIDGVHGYDKRLALTRSSISVGVGKDAISNSYGTSLERSESFASASVEVKAEEAGKKGAAGESRLTRNWGEIDFQALFCPAAERALKAMDAKSIASERMPIVWMNDVFARILSVMFGGTLSADSVQSRRSPWAGRLESQISSDNFNLVDDGLREAGVGTREFDDDGIPQQMTPIISKGILKNFLYDNYTANKDKVLSTGNAHRSYTSFPTPYPNNLTLKPTNVRLEELIEETEHGLYVTETIGEWLSNPISGDLSATVTNGFLIEKGELTQPVKDVIISGNFFKIINGGINLIANDLQNSGSTYAPSIRVAEMALTESK
ncbi:MAG: hypothetical protein QG670_2007 [Thermoproteota archaeon]|nr:hypothetical protein [Thermoproteota archaeon]